MALQYPNQVGKTNIAISNGTNASGFVLSNKATGCWNKPFVIAHNTWNGSARPTLEVALWNTVTKDTYAAPVRLRCDMPAQLVSDVGLSSGFSAIAVIILFNSSKIQSSTVTGLRLFNGDPNNMSNAWSLTSTAPVSIVIEPDSYKEVQLFGSAKFNLSHNMPVNNGDLNVLCLGCDNIAGSTSVLVESVLVTARPIPSWRSDTPIKMETPPSHSFIRSDWYNDYAKAIHHIDSNYHYQNNGTLGPATESDPQGFKLESALSSRAYNLFEPSSIADDPERKLTSMWAPLTGMGLSDGESWWIYRVMVSWTATVDTNDNELSFPFRVFTAGIGAGAIQNLAPQVMPYGEPITITRVFNLVFFNTPPPGIAILPRAKPKYNTNIWSSNFSCQVIPYRS